MPRRKPRDPERSPDLPHNWIERHIQRLEAFLLYDPSDIDDWEYRCSRLTAPGQYTPLKQARKTISLGEQWGGPDTTAFFRKTVAVPDSYGGEDIYLDIFLDGGEAQLSINGRLWQGLDWNRSLIPLGEFAQPGRKLLLEIEAFIINYPYDDRRKDERDMHCFERARFIRRDRAIESALNDFRFAFDAYLYYYGKEAESEIESFLLFHLEKACRLLGPGFSDRLAARASAEAGASYLKEHLFGSPWFKKPGTIHICGHSHLDIVYLWPIKETFRKNARTASNMLSLMREYPDFHFSNSQPYLYEKLKERYPDLYKEVKDRILEGRWEAVGAMYLEPDGNLPGAESLVRHLLFGQRFLEREFGFTSRICWLPDVFGIMYTLPQILRQSGVDRLLTAKLNIWNDVNRFPHDSFRWRGPDGSEVLTHFTPSHFGQPFSYGNLEAHWTDYREKHEAPDTLFIYGWADGGGGPTREMVEMSLRGTSFPGIPDNRINTAEGFFDRLEENMEELAVWDDELYLEAHRGTLTSKGDLKLLNRKAEYLYRDAEIVSAIAYSLGYEELQSELNDGWKLVLLNQFHDTITGSHSPAGVPDIKADYREAFRIGEGVKEKALSWLVQRARCSLVMNTLSWNRSDLVELTGKPEFADAAALRCGEKLFPVQRYKGRIFAFITNLPSLGWHTIEPAGEVSDQGAALTLMSDGRYSTAFYVFSFDERGRIDFLYDNEAGREVLSAPGNDFQLFEDDPGYKFSAWDLAYHLEEYSRDVVLEQPWKVLANGPVFVLLSASFRAGDSLIEQEMWLYKESRRIDFKTRVDWKERKRMLKVAFPLAVRSRTASFHLPFGSIERPTHRNTSWEEAKFEVCGHSWADISEGNYGVSLLNDCKYGYDAKEHILRLSLLRAPVRPDPESDAGEHLFTYSLLPHIGDRRIGETNRRAYELNAPPLIISRADNEEPREEETLPDEFSFLSVENASLVVETVKKAEDREGLIVRSYESWGGACETGMHFHSSLTAKAKWLTQCNLLEKEQTGPDGTVVLNGEDSVRISYGAGEIKSFYLPLP